MITSLEGALEIDHERGVIYFHEYNSGSTKLRICRLGAIPDMPKENLFIDVTHMVGVSFGEHRTHRVYPGCSVKEDRRCVHGNAWGGECVYCDGYNEPK